MPNIVTTIIVVVVVLWFAISLVYSLLAWNTAKERGRTDAKSFFTYGLLAGPFAWKASQDIELAPPLMLESKTSQEDKGSESKNIEIENSLDENVIPDYTAQELFDNVEEAATDTNQQEDPNIDGNVNVFESEEDPNIFEQKVSSPNNSENPFAIEDETEPSINIFEEAEETNIFDIAEEPEQTFEITSDVEEIAFDLGEEPSKQFETENDSDIEREFSLPKRPPAPKVVDDIDAIVDYEARVLEAMFEGKQAPEMDTSGFSSVNLPKEEPQPKVEFIEASAFEEDEKTPEKKTRKFPTVKKPKKPKVLMSGNKDFVPESLNPDEASPPAVPTMGKCPYCKEESYSDWHGLCSNCGEVWLAK